MARKTKRLSGLLTEEVFCQLSRATNWHSDLLGKKVAVPDFVEAALLIDPEVLAPLVAQVVENKSKVRNLGLQQKPANLPEGRVDLAIAEISAVIDKYAEER